MAINIQGGLYATCAYSTDSTITAAPSQGTCSDGNTEGPFTWNDFTFAGVLTGLQEASYNRLAPTCFGVSGSTAGRRLLSDNSAQDYEGQTYYPGVALVLSGPMTVSALLDTCQPCKAWLLQQDTLLVTLGPSFLWLLPTMLSSAAAGHCQEGPQVRGDRHVPADHLVQGTER